MQIRLAFIDGLQKLSKQSKIFKFLRNFSCSFQRLELESSWYSEHSFFIIAYNHLQLIAK